ncbi:molybdenum cofactor guanylyltransferase MobA [Hyphomicrobium sp.]|jgi:molybdopterin-guanine dinucleotide biosynthesis protein A|uniref:molybdenum cofactor guanylyltransferase MobA n=1 Tax=Hyphomicrobium sp. TaxID=82 RepID=UPI002C1940BA|nr:molybdenum cofactor guanylyltransferase MobA [Hyphomicrobium sp.]HVZ06074.1 molybdenum cofactor guanylyltransferase MobA [Hyphomicrobium sp.]
MAAKPQILGVILAGGKSRRFGGSDKGLAELAAQPVLSHVIARFRPQVGRLVLNVNGDASRFAQFGLETISDRVEPELGPLSGILAALDWQRENASDCTAIATVSTDVPFLPLDLVEKLDVQRGDGVAIAMSAERRHPTIALWPLGARDAVVDALKRRALSVNALTEGLKAVAVPFAMRNIDGVDVDPFFNVNTRDDLAIAKALIGKI